MRFAEAQQVKSFRRSRYTRKVCLKRALPAPVLPHTIIATGAAALAASVPPASLVRSSHFCFSTNESGSRDIFHTFSNNLINLLLVDFYLVNLVSHFKALGVCTSWIVEYLKGCPCDRFFYILLTAMLNTKEI